MPPLMKRVIKDVEFLSKNIKTKWNGEDYYFYESDKSNILSGHVMIMGNEDCPYFGGFYFFHHEFPDNYPVGPPKWKFLTNDGKTRFNPNMYQITSGKVCLSILGTWSESSWAPAQHISSVIEAVRTHLFHNEPITNEPGYQSNHPYNAIYRRMIYYQNLNFNVYYNIVQTPDYAKPFLQVMKDNFLKNKEYFRKYIDDNKHLHGKEEYITYDNQRVKYDFETLEKKYKEICDVCES